MVRGVAASRERRKRGQPDERAGSARALHLATFMIAPSLLPLVTLVRVDQ